MKRLRKPNSLPPLPVKQSGDSLEVFCKALKSHQNFLLACHVLPEGDALGSLYAMESLLRRLGKKTCMVGEAPLPKSLTSLFPSERWHTVEELKRRPIRWDALVVTDCPTLERIGKVKDLLRPDTAIFNIDHHVSNNFFGQFNYVRPKAAASGEAAYEIFQHLNLELTRDEAQSLYIALSTDTGSYRYSNTCAGTHRLAAKLIEKGIDLEAIHEGVYSNYSLNKIYLYSHLLKKVRTASDDQIAWVTMTRQDVKRYGADYEDSEGFIDFLRLIHTVKVAFFASELLDGKTVRVSFRSKGDYDVQKIASLFDGGGHRKSSGCLFQGVSLKKAVERVLEKIHQEFDL